MSYWISLQNENGLVPHVDRFQEGGTQPVGGSTDAELNVTFNYYPKFDFKSLHEHKAKETILDLVAAIVSLEDDVDEDYWKPTDGNVRKALMILLRWARQYPNCVWRVS